MLYDAKGFEKIYIATGYTDLRKGIDGLARMVQETFSQNPFSKNTIFMFCGKSSKKIKALCWEGDGFVLLYKRLEDGKYHWPRNKQEAMEITQKQFEYLMDGMDVIQKQSIKQVNPEYVG